MINYEIPHDTENLEEHIIAIHLKNVIPETVAHKLMNGVHIEQDGKQLINKKSIKLFLQYLCEKMYNAAKNNKNKTQNVKAVAKEGTAILDEAIKYFNDDKIIGELYDESGKLYKKAPELPKEIAKATKTMAVAQKKEPDKPQQFTLFSLLEENNAQQPLAVETPRVEQPTQEAILFSDTPDDVEDDEENNEYGEPDEDETPCAFDVDRETGEILSPIPAEHSVPVQPYSPLYQKYLSFQGQYPQAVIAYRLGDFFEIFGDNAIKVSNRLELILTGRDFGLTERIPMVGFPYHASDTYFRKIAEFSSLIVVEDDTATPYVLEEKMSIKTPAIKENEPTMYENNEETDVFEEERALQQFFDKDALCALYELFDYNLDMQ
jgi:hypothetical protein